MALEGLFLNAFGAITFARTMIFPNFVFSETYFTNKNETFKIENIKLCFQQTLIFVKLLNIIGVYKQNTNINIGSSVAELS